MATCFKRIPGYRDRLILSWAHACVLCLFFLMCVRGFGAEWYVAPNATREGIGTIDNPWLLQTAVDRITPITGGDVLWLRGGIYQSNYLCFLTGQENRHITVRSYPNERVIFDGSPLYPNAFPLTIEGAWTIYRDFEVMHSATWTNSSTPVAIQCLGQNVKLINLVIHDAGQGIGFWKEAVNSEVYGCILYYNGADSQEHGIYTQNDVGTKRIHDSIIFHNSGYGIHAYAQSGYSRGYDIEGNALFHNGRENGELFVGSFYPGDRLSVVSNYSLALPQLTAPNFRLTDRDHSSNPNGSAVVRDNYIVGGGGFTAQDFLSLNFRNNLMVGTNHFTHCRPPPGQPLGAYSWDFNRYYGTAQFLVGPTEYDFLSWQALSGLDANSTLQPGLPTGVDVFVRPNRYEPKRANIIIYNWDMASTVTVNVSNILAPGDVFVVRSAHDYLGRPVLSNVFSGGPLILPMTNLSVAMPRRDQETPAHTAPFFAAFVLSVPYVAPSNLLAHWSFDEGSGTEIHAANGEHEGTFGGNPTWIPGRYGSALHFDGNDYVTVADDVDLDLTNDLSISFWFKPANVINETDGRLDLLAKYISYWMIINYPFNDGRLTFGFNSGSPYVRSTRTVWEPDQWYHVVGTFNGIEMKLYVNGVLEGRTATTFRILNTTFDLQLGGNSIQHIYYAGGLDELHLFDYALNEAQILDLFHTAPPINVAPTIQDIGPQAIDEGNTLLVQAVAADADAAANPLTFTLDPGAPEGAFVHPSTGQFTWTPTEAHGPSTNIITIRVADNDTPNLSTPRSFSVVVREVNRPPVFSHVPNQTAAEETTLVLFNLASDPDYPPNNLAFGLEAGAPDGSRVNPYSGGVFVWNPTEYQGPSTNVVTMRVTDNGIPSMSSTQSFTVIVTEVPRPPQLELLLDRTVMAQTPVTFTVAATDFDYPANPLTYSLAPEQAGTAAIDPVTGHFAWTASSVAGAHTFTVRVADNSAPPLSDARSFVVTVVVPPTLKDIVLRDNLLTIRWDAVTGQSYRVQYTAELNPTAWSDLPGDVTATSTIATKEQSLPTNGKGFYRVVLISQ